ncbi:hypothetical protein HMPREF2690_07705 [Corynebacterium sp. HMSC034E11]|uniref:hypothetical protein n=1 Tax=Corynebacterium sp. HMSC034E11 TaxID=1715169 RepID=UPI0008AA10E4|nr:hypothetical protein [Corynebacterium sp. HMSC034E11]OHO33271.1 hypothetical protein HMPREF2690_07705 [Corynebacterium sp. HMSC034E11]
MASSNDIKVELHRLHDEFYTLLRTLESEVPGFQSAASEARRVFYGSSQSSLQEILHLLMEAERQILDTGQKLRRTLTALEEYGIERI